MSACLTAPEVADGTAPWPGQTIWRVVLVVAAVHALAWGGLWAAAPGRLFDYLGMEPRHDAWAWQFFTKTGTPPERIPTPREAALWHMLAFLWLAQGGFLVLAAWRPRSLGGLAVVPLIGHALGTALWAWALATWYTFPAERLTFPRRGPLAVMLLNEAIWLLPLLAFLLARPADAERHSQENGTGVQ